MVTVSMSGQEYDLFLDFKSKFEKFSEILVKKKNENFEPRNFFGVSNFKKEEIDEYLKNSKDEWEK
jgi:hypothetical protein